MTINDILTPTFITPVLVAFIGFLVAVTSSLIAKEQKVSEFRQAWINEIRKDFAKTLSLMFETAIDIHTCKKKILKAKRNLQNIKIQQINMIIEIENLKKNYNSDLEPKKNEEIPQEIESLIKNIDDEKESLIKKVGDEKEIIEKLMLEMLEIKSKIHNIKELRFSITLRLNPTKDKKITSKIESIESLIIMTRKLKKEKNISLHLKLIKVKLKQLRNDIHKMFKDEWEIVKRGEKKFLIWITTGEFVVGTMIIAFYVLFALVNFPEYFPGIK